MQTETEGPIKTPTVEALPGFIAYGVRYLRPAGTDYATRRNY